MTSFCVDFCADDGNLHSPAPQNDPPSGLLPRDYLHPAWSRSAAQVAPDLHAIAPVWNYSSVLAMGATVVCAGGALLQAGAPSAVAEPAPAPAAHRQSAYAARPAVPVPAVAAPASPAATFTSGASCSTSTCKGLAFVELRLPQVQDRVRELRAQMQAFQTAHTPQNLQTHQSILAYRAADLAKREASLTVRSRQLDQQQQNLLAGLALQPHEVTLATNLLLNDAAYQNQLQQLRAAEQAIAVEYSTPDLDDSQLGSRYATYYEQESQLRQTAQIVLARYVAAARVQSPDPLWQEASYQAGLQQLMDLIHQRQVLALEQQAIAQTQTYLTERRTEFAALLRQYAALQRQLEDQNQILQEYVAERQSLQEEMAANAKAGRAST